jgi:hypothetical protein
MGPINMATGNAGTVARDNGILYPLMLISAMAVIVFSIAGIATMMGWMPSALTSGGDRVRARPAAPSTPRAASRVAAVPTACRDCGVVESLREVEQSDESSGLGAVAGAGAYAGHEIEKRSRKSVNYEIRVRMNDGTYRTLHEPTRPALTVGQKVRVTDQGVVAAG